MRLPELITAINRIKTGRSGTGTERPAEINFKRPKFKRLANSFVRKTAHSYLVVLLSYLLFLKIFHNIFHGDFRKVMIF